MNNTEDLLERVTDSERDLLLVYMAKRWPDKVETALNAIRELELGQQARGKRP